MKKILLIAGLILLGAFIIIQFIPYGHQHSNPPVAQEPNWTDNQTRELAARACFDCHSNETDWPWYSNIAPVSWLVTRDVEIGRRVLNFSEWNRPQHEAGEVSEVVRSGEMPPSYYAFMHPEANLSEAEMQTLINGIRSSSSLTVVP